MRSFPILAFPAPLLLALIVLGAAGFATRPQAWGASLPEDDARSCAAYTPRNLAKAADLMNPFLSQTAFTLLPIPAETAKIVCAWAETAIAGQMSRQDTLWFQAGYGGLPGGAAGMEAPALPKWESANPSIFRVLPGPVGPLDPNPFTGVPQR